MEPHSQRREELLGIDGFRQILGSPSLKTLLTISFHCLRREGNNWQSPERSVLPNHLHSLIAIHFRHHDIHEDDRDVRSGFEFGNGFASGSGGDYGHAPAFNNTAKSEDVAHVVVDDQYFFADQSVVGAVQAI